MIIGILLTLYVGAQSQALVGLESAWSDRYDEWKLYYVVDSTEYQGEIESTYSLDDTYDDWTYEIEDLTGRYYKRNIGKPVTYALTGGEHDISVSPVWMRDRNEWRISGDKRYTLRTRYHGIGDEWILYHGKEKLLYFFTSYEGDMREWVIEDYVGPHLDLAVKIAAVQTIMINVLPRLKTK